MYGNIISLFIRCVDATPEMLWVLGTNEVDASYGPVADRDCESLTIIMGKEKIK